MAEVTRVGSLELEHDLRFQWRQWQVSRALWIALLALMAATALGAFGNGPVTRTRSGSPGGPLWVEYDRVARFGASIRLVVHVRPRPDGTVSLTVERSLLEALRVQQVTPPPLSAALVENGIAYQFRAATPGPATVIFEVQPAVRWAVGGAIVSPGGAVPIRQFILP